MLVLPVTQYVAYPRLIIEVLSPRTEAYDSSTKTLCERGKKFKLYQRLIAFMEYVLVSAEEIEIEIFRKNDRGKCNTVRLSYQKIHEMGWVSGVEPQPNEFIDFQRCPLSPKGDATLSTPLREHPLLIFLVFILFLSEPYWCSTYCWKENHSLMMRSVFSSKLNK
jgi:Putative restriction endonuclease